MNEQERLQRIIDILADNVHEMCAIDGDNSNNVILDVNMDGVQMVAKEITVIFKQSYKDTRSRCEKLLDKQFAAMSVKPRIYHFRKEVATFNAVTVALTKRWRKDVTEDIVKNCVEAAHDKMENKATFSIAILKQARLYGVAICDKSDQFSKRTGRMKAKGRLMQHLLKEANKE